MKVNQIKLGSILSYATIFINTVVGLIYTPIMTRMLGQSEYGLYSLIATVISYLTVLDLGFGNAIIVYNSKIRAKNNKDEEYRLNGMFLIIYSIIGIIAFFAGVALYLNVENLFGNTMTAMEIDKAKTMMVILIFNLVITFPFTVFSSLITAYEKFVFSKLLNIIRILLMPCIMIPLLFMGYKSIAMVIVTTIINIVVIIANTIYCIKKLKVKFRFGRFNVALLKEIFGYSFFVFLAIVIEKINWGVDKYLLGALVGTTAVAIYSVASQLNNIYLSFSTAITGVLLPKVTKMVSANCDDEELSDLFIKVGRIQYIIMALIITGFVIFGNDFILLWAGEEYQSAFYIACILMIPVTVPLIQNLGGSILQAKNKHKFKTVVFFIMAIGNIAISIPLINRYGEIGAAIGTAILFVLGSIIFMNIYYYKVIHINIPKFWKEIFKLTIPVAIIFIPSMLLLRNVKFNIIGLAFGIIIYTCLYSILIWKMGMNSYEKELIIKPIKKIIKKR